jgi:hypothetical protein
MNFMAGGVEHGHCDGHPLGIIAYPRRGIASADITGLPAASRNRWAIRAVPLPRAPKRAVHAAAPISLRRTGWPAPST